MRSIDTKEISKLCRRPTDELEISKSIAKALDSQFLEKATEENLPIAREINGIGVDLGLYLYSRGIKEIEDYDQEKLITPDLPQRLIRQLELLNIQIEGP